MSQPVLVGVDQNPLPPTQLLARLQEIDERLGVRWSPHNESWAVTERWVQGDKRWVLFQSGQIGEPVDHVCWIPKDADPNSVGDHMARILGEMDNTNKATGTRGALIERLNDLRNANDQQMAKAREALADPIMDEAAYQAKKILSKNHRGDIAREEGIIPGA